MRRQSVLITFGLALLGHAAAAQVVEYYHLDAVGNVRVATDSSGNVMEQHDYLPFGEECTTGPCASNPGVAGGQTRKFTGKERDQETGYDYFGARYYGSKTGRFTAIDPVYTWKENLEDPQRWNRYAYGRNNPLRYIDPDGRDVRYASPEVRIFVENQSQREGPTGQKLRATLALYEGGDKPDLLITSGPVRPDLSGQDSDATFEPQLARSSTGTLKLERATMTFGNNVALDASDERSAWVTRHEFGHADLAARDPAGYERLNEQSRNPDGTVTPHDTRPIEAAADAYAGGPDPGKPRE